MVTCDVISHVILCFFFTCSDCRFGVQAETPNGANEGNPQLCVFCLQTLAGGDRGRSHGDGQTGASSGADVSDL